VVKQAHSRVLQCNETEYNDRQINIKEQRNKKQKTKADKENISAIRNTYESAGWNLHLLFSGDLIPQSNVVARAFSRECLSAWKLAHGRTSKFGRQRFMTT
jgi:hypothetical protein